MIITNSYSKEAEIKHLYDISQSVTQNTSWKIALDEIVTLTRSIFIFDNLVVYLITPAQKSLEVVYARAAGRGRSAEADMTWGENIANTVIHTREVNRARTAKYRDKESPGTALRARNPAEHR